MAEIHDPARGMGRYRDGKGRGPEGLDTGLGAKALRIDPGNKALIEVNARVAVVPNDPTEILRHFAQTFDKANRDGVIVIHTELQAGCVAVFAQVVDHLFHDRPVTARWSRDDNRLRDVGKQAL